MISDYFVNEFFYFYPIINFAHSKYTKMAEYKGNEKLKQMIINAIDDHKITRDEYDMILHIASEDGIIDSQEQALLNQLQELIENKTVKMVAK